METIRNLINLDIVSLRAKKSGGLAALVIVLAAGMILGFLFSPLMFIISELVLALVIAPLIISLETRSGSERSLFVVPADRKSIVTARFTLICGGFTAVCLVLYLLMLLAIGSGLYVEENGDIFAELAAVFDAGGTILGYYNVFFALFFAVGLMINASRLRKYFRYGAKDKKSGLLRGLVRIVLIWIIVFASLTLLMYLLNAPIIGTVMIMLLSMASQLAEPANGMLLCLVLLVIGFGVMAYNAVCSAIEYEEREL
ncbi:MAG: hypothetical protein IJ874_02620 [Ruminococcus sp.]|nr:hypothetical protein [Ruminococcus sp.]